MPLSVWAQPSNDECEFAQFLGSITEYCSEISEFTNINATQSSEPLPFCWFTNHNHDVWFSFVPTAPATYIQLFGKLDVSDTNVLNPSMAIYEGTCNNLTEIGCGSNGGAGADIVELTVTDLTIGQVYYIRVDARNEGEGDFHMCLESFIPTPSPESDCPDAVVLCDKSQFVVPNLQSVGNIPNEMTGPCITPGTGQDLEEASVWYTWTCDQSGTLEFTISPNNPNSSEEDIDFIVYEFPGGLNDCANRVAVRCMLSGETGGQSAAQNEPCFGDTGLMAGDTDIQELAGCSPGDNNFLAPLDMIAGQSYGILINNFSMSGFGFGIEFGGTGTFLGPEVDFDILTLDAFECDKEVVFMDQSNSLTDVISDYTWNFGVDAVPPFSNQPGPHNVIYESFGNKVISLTVTTERGCTVTKILEQFIDPCCQDTSTLDITGFANDILCEGELGSIIAEGISGAPAYNFAVDGGEFGPNPFFGGLEPGPHEIFVQDKKGCIDSTIVNIDEPPPLNIEILTQDTTIELGTGIDISSLLTPPGANVSISWDPEAGLDCVDCLDPFAIPEGTTTYTITIIDPNGCIDRDEITIITEIVRPVFPPNVFTPDNDGNNDIFTVGFGPQVRDFKSLRVYDRWGNLVYEGFGLPINDFNVGWNGRFKGELVNPGVFAWIAEVEFIDNVTLFYTGSITVVR